MIQFRDIISRFSERVLFAGTQGMVSYSQFAEKVDGFSTSKPEARSFLAIELDGSVDRYAHLIASLISGDNIFLGSKFPEGDLAPFAEDAPLLVMRSGGSTGKPVHVVHSVECFTNKYVVKDRPPNRQLVLYAANHLAGLDTFLQALHQGGTLVVPEDNSAQAIAAAMEASVVDVLPATPTMLQFLLLSGELEGKDLSSVKIIPHGAEPMPAELRKRLEAVFPGARMRQRYGMVELGALPTVEDPEDPSALFLEAPNHTWKVHDGELHVWSPSRMLGTLEEGLLDKANPWFRTGDLAERTQRGSIRILGRRDFLINVGGRKVIPGTVENLLMEQPDILEAQVYPVPNPMTGQTVGAKIVCSGSPELVDILSSLRSYAREKGFGLEYIPTRIEIVPELGINASGKRERILKA